MLCSALAELAVPSGALVCAPRFALAPTALAAAIATAALAVLRLRAKAGTGLGRHGLSALLTILSAGALSISVERPVWVAAADDADVEKGLVVALVDMSESFWRQEGVAKAALGRLADTAGRIAQADEAPAGWSATVLGFADAARAQSPEQPLSRLPDMIRAARPKSGGGRSSGGRALDAALDRIREHGGRGAILLASDGRFDEEISQRLLDRAVADGVAVSVLGAGATAPASGLIAADLGPEQEVGREAILRATVLGGGVLSAERGDASAELQIPDAAVLQPVRLTTRFGARGLRHVRLRYAGDGFAQEKTLFTLVRGPAKVLALGEAPWLARLDPSRWIVERADPASPPTPGEFDLVVIDALSPRELPDGYDRALLEASGRTGIFLVNGGLRGDEESPQVIGDWNGSALSPILPVDSDPRLFIQEPPGRDIVILIDVSGSMGSSLGLGKAVAHAILDQLRSVDTLAVLPFSDSPGAAFDRRPATPGNIEQARRFVDRLTAGGGTAPDSTLRRAAQLRTNYCAFFFISDGVFRLPPTSPRCFTTAVLTKEGSKFPEGVSDWGQEIRLKGRVGGVTLDYFEPDERETYYRPDPVRPIPANDVAPLTGQSVPGVAIAYPRIDAEVDSLHPDPPPDPVLVRRRDPARPGVAAAVFLSAVPDAAPIEDIDAVLSGILGWSRPDRYDIRMRRSGDRFTVSVLLLEGDTLPETLSGSLRVTGGAAQPLAFRAAGPPGRFEASFTRRLGDSPASGELVLAEAGGPPQVIPVSLPASADLGAEPAQGEAFDFGVDATALRRIAARTGGVDLSDEAPRLDVTASPARRIALHPWTICLALTFLAGALWIQGKPD